MSMVGNFLASTQQKILISDNAMMAVLLGHHDENLRFLNEQFPDTTIFVRGNEITIDGTESEKVGHLIDEVVTLIKQGHQVDRANLVRSIEMVKSHESPSQVLGTQVLRSAAGKTVRPKTSGQKRYVEAIEENVITFGIGPAGTGKSYLAVAQGLRCLQSKIVNRIILTRPAVEAGEKLGFLPGDMLSKVDPYLRPLYDALYDMLDSEATHRLMDRGTIEVAPLAYMRGRTLNSSFIILDEAQNTTPEQMKMFLTRIGFGSKAVVTADDSQIDIVRGKSGIEDLESVLSGIEGLSFVHLSSSDVVRHPIVASIIDAYEKRSRPAGHQSTSTDQPD